MKREEFSAKTRDLVGKRAAGHCEKCGVSFAGGRPEYDHILPAEYGGRATIANCQAICKGCHAAKTKMDVRGMRKADRQRRAYTGAELPKQAIASRPKAEAPARDKLPVPPWRSIYRKRIGNDGPKT